MKKFINQNIFLINENSTNATKDINTKSRNLVVLPLYIGKTVLVHNGKTFTKISIVREMVGHKLGEFVKTRKTFKFKKK